jgi:hypothetical protein
MNDWIKKFRYLVYLPKNLQLSQSSVDRLSASGQAVEAYRMYVACILLWFLILPLVRRGSSL